MVVIMVVVSVIPVALAMVSVMSPIPVIMPVTRHVYPVVPIVANKVHGATTGVILRAVARPVPLVSRRYMQIDRYITERRVAVNHHRP